jgi:hypothetical protein
MTDDEILSMLAALPTAEIAKRSVLVYRCARGCALLCVLVVDGRRFGYKPAVKRSTDLNERNSAPAARETKTTDGDRRWRPYPFPMSAAGGWLLAECDHVHARVDCDSIDADARAATRRAHSIQLRHNEVR